MKTRTSKRLMNSRLNTFVIATICAVAIAFPIALSGRDTSTPVKHHHYRVVVLPPDGGSDSFGAGYLFYLPLTDRGTYGVAADTATPGVYNSYTWTDGQQIDLQPLPQLPNLTGTNTYINRINQLEFAAGYGTRTNSITNASVDNAAVWTPLGQIFELSTPSGDQSHAVWINDFGQVSGWIANSTADPCSSGVLGNATGFQTQGVVWVFGVMVPLGTLGGTNSYGEFMNNRGQVSGHSETSNTVDPNTGCPPFDPFIWENGKMTDINPGNFGGGIGGTNFLNNRGQAVGFGTLYGDVSYHPFLWDGRKITDLFTVGNLGGSFGSAYYLNEKGHVIGISSLPGDQAFHAVLWREHRFTDLGTLPGDACSEPFFISSRDQVLGISADCNFDLTTSHAFLWEDGEMVDLNMLIPADSGIQLQGAGWMNESGEIAVQGVLTDTGDERAVLLVPDGDCDQECEAAILATEQAAATSSNGVKSSTLSPQTRVQLRQPRLKHN